MRILVPNVLGYLRIALGAVFFLLAWQGFVYASVITFLTAMATDVLDGYLARKLHQVSRQGIVLDALSDKMVLVAAFVFILLRTDLPAWIAWLAIGYHALTLFGLAVLLVNRKKVLEHAWTGKLAALTQTAVVAITLIGWHMTNIGMLFVWLMVATNLLSIGFYAFIGIRAMKK